MAENAQNWKSLRSDLRRHLSQMHGGVGVGISPALSVEQLEELHSLLHLDCYAMPPHTHDEPSAAWQLGEVKLKYDENYSDTVVRLARGEVL